MSRIICDIDCTLYSYREFVEANYLYPKDSMMALFSRPAPDDSFPGVERVWRKKREEIKKRILALIDVSQAHGSVHFVSAFPAEKYKFETFAECGVEMISSYPASKLGYLKDNAYQEIILTIGDRPVDYKISQHFQSKLVFLPVYRSLQWAESQRYTQGLISEVTKTLMAGL
jgi:hypothetical protein